MSEQPFKLIDEKEVDQEQCWTYSIQFEFISNKKVINYLTITDHPWKKKGREGITKELILNTFKEKLNEAILNPEPKKTLIGKETILFPKEFPLTERNIN